MNPFLVRETLPDFYAIKSKHVIPAIDNVIKDNTEVIFTFFLLYSPDMTIENGQAEDASFGSLVPFI